jgi:hypothetical protein
MKPILKLFKGDRRLNFFVCPDPFKKIGLGKFLKPPEKPERMSFSCRVLINSAFEIKRILLIQCYL